MKNDKNIYDISDDQYYISDYSIESSYNIDKRTIDVSLSLEYSSFDELYNEIMQKFKEKNECFIENFLNDNV